MLHGYRYVLLNVVVFLLQYTVRDYITFVSVIALCILNLFKLYDYLQARRQKNALKERLLREWQIENHQL